MCLARQSLASPSTQQPYPARSRLAAESVLPSCSKDVIRDVLMSPTAGVTPSGCVYVPAGASVRVLGPDGSLIDDVSAAALSLGPPVSHCAIDADGAVLFASSEGGVAAFSLASRALVWVVPSDGLPDCQGLLFVPPAPGMAPSNGSLLKSSLLGRVDDLDPLDGAVRASIPVRCSSSMALDAGTGSVYVYCCDLGSRADRLVSLRRDRASGTYAVVDLSRWNDAQGPSRRRALAVVHPRGGDVVTAETYLVEAPCLLATPGASESRGVRVFTLPWLEQRAASALTAELGQVDVRGLVGDPSGGALVALDSAGAVRGISCDCAWYY